MERVARLQSLPLHILHGPQVKPAPPDSTHTAPSERDASLLEPLRPSLKVLVNEPPSRLPNGSATERDARLHFSLLGAWRS